MKDDRIPPPVTKKSSRAELWEELCAARAEIDQQQRAINDLTTTLDSERSAAKKLQERLAGAHMRLDVIRAAVATPGVT